MEDTAEEPVDRSQKCRFQGWRFGVAAAAWAAFAVMLVNIIFLTAVMTKFGESRRGDILTAIDGNCNAVNAWTRWSHIVINGLSAMLLSASNYTMQATAAPTRSEINAQHVRGSYCDIGVASIRNILGRIAWTRTLVWCILGLSSIPIHLLYNSCIFKTVNVNIYDVLVVNSGFLSGGAFTYEQVKLAYEDEFGYGVSYASPTYSQALQIQQTFFVDSSRYDNYSNKDCMGAYGTSFVSEHGPAILVTNGTAGGINNTVYTAMTVGKVHTGYSYDWICADKKKMEGCDIPTMQQHASNWTIQDRNIQYCLSERTQPHCKLEISTTILAVVIFMNACKAGCMFWILWKQQIPTLVTVGDAVTSFLDEPDELTRGRCLMGKFDVRLEQRVWEGKKPLPKIRPKKCDKIAEKRSPPRWFWAVSDNAWLVTSTILIIILAYTGTLLGAGAAALRPSLGERSIFSLGFGNADGRAMINIGLPSGESGSLIAAVLVTNLPQVICSLLYVAYNNFFTAMLLAHEWNRYFVGPKRSLRVTTPRGHQRSTYYLHVPYTYGIPLVFASALLHWLISQSIFLVRTDGWKYGHEIQEASGSQVGYSCLPIMLVIILGTTMLLLAWIISRRKFDNGALPIAGSCSVAIAAACHRPDDDVDAAYLPISWGDITAVQDYELAADDVGHCCFTSYEVQDPFHGRWYAG